MQVVYYSGASEFTHRFVKRLEAPAQRIPLHKNDPTITVEEPYVLIVPTYGIGTAKTAVPPSVKKFLRKGQNTENCVAVIGTGNTNFGSTYCLAAELVARRLHVPLAYKFELLGTDTDLETVTQILNKLGAT